ncbi:MAG: glycosyltransferase family 2 protein, partial [Bacteroidales bacterium]
MTPLISIVIPLYNAASFIAECLDTVLKQTYSSYEVIMINDASTDQSAEVIARYLEARPEIKNVRFLNNSTNMGPGGCRNRGIEAARGEYIYFADADDEMLPECLELLERPMRHHPFDFVAGGIEIQYAGSSKTQRFLQQQMAVYNASEIDYDHLFESFFKMVVWNKLYRKRFLSDHRLLFEPDIFHEDQLFLFRLAFCTEAYSVVPFVTYRYVKRENSITGLYTKKNYTDLIRVIGGMKQVAEEYRSVRVKQRAARKHFFMLQCNLSMHVLDSGTIPRHEQAGYVQKFGKIGLPISEYLA